MVKVPKSNRLSVPDRHAIGSLSRLKPNVSSLSRQFKVTRKTIRKWLAEGARAHPSYNDKPGRGRKPVLTPALKKYARRLGRKRRTTRKIVEHMARWHHLTVSRALVARHLRTGRNHLKWAPIKRAKALRIKNRILRYNFCLDNLHINPRKLVFMDAKDLYMYLDTLGHTRYCWQDVKNPAPVPEGSSPVVFRFYAAVAWGRKSALRFVPPSPPEGSRAHKSKESYTSQHYITMMEGLKEEVVAWFPDGNYNIIRDHARQHISKASMKAMADMGLQFKEDYPPQSFDMNIIENVWGVLDGILVGTRARSGPEWRHAIEAAWDKIKQSTIDELVDGLPNRLQHIMDLDGQWVKHH